jgi:predicted protein tyrosine phosphatase
MKKILFVCTQNRIRSLTAERLFQGRNGCQTKSAGISASARVVLTEDLIMWADLVVFMEQNHRDYVAKTFQTPLTGKKLLCLDVQDIYYYGDPELQGELESKMRPHIK